MYFNNLIRNIGYRSLNISKRNKVTVQIAEKVEEDIKNEKYKPRKHPGTVRNTPNKLPDSIIKAINNVVLDFPIKSIINDSKALVSYLINRHAPKEPEEVNEKRRQIEQKILNQKGVTEESEEVKRETLNRNEGKVLRMLKTHIHPWQAINYNTYTALQYLIGRAAPNYAVLMKIFSEINARNPGYKPRAFFDFGSGVGTGTWVAQHFWKHSLFEYFCVDISPDMNDLADVILRGGFANKKSSIKGLFHRQFLPASNVPYDIVLSAYSLMELPNRQSRLETILKLWNKTMNFLVIVEIGNTTGFKLVNEARDFILNLSNESEQGFVYMPCPHSQSCPRFLKNDTPCNFETNYYGFSIGGPQEIEREMYSYVVLKKGKRSESDLQWPRIVRPTLVRSKHTICRMCATNGKLEEVIFTASKHGKTLYHCARSSKWGDLLPIDLKD